MGRASGHKFEARSTDLRAQVRARRRYLGDAGPLHYPMRSTGSEQSLCHAGGRVFVYTTTDSATVTINADDFESRTRAMATQIQREEK